MTGRRREFLAGMGAVVATGLAAPWIGGVALAEGTQVKKIKSPFRVAVIDDEISQDFGRACEVASQEFGMEWIELRGMWNKNIANLDAKEIAEAHKILKKYGLRVTDIASPLFKVHWPEAPKSKFSEPAAFGADFTFEQQGEVLERSIALAKTFKTDRVRCFDFWRLDDQAPYRTAINDKLREATNKLGKENITLILENEAACNTATGAESAAVLKAVTSRSFMLNWDPGNAAAAGDTPYPDGYNLLPKDRIGHCHCKDVVKSGAKYEWAAMGTGIIDWAGQFKALKRDGYRHTVSLETHWTGGGTPEASSRKSWAGMKELLSKSEAL
jgi:L-ribulose-5-phosphate 3-epimerase